MACFSPGAGISLCALYSLQTGGTGFSLYSFLSWCTIVSFTAHNSKISLLAFLPKISKGSDVSFDAARSGVSRDALQSHHTCVSLYSGLTGGTCYTWRSNWTW